MNAYEIVVLIVLMWVLFLLYIERKRNRVLGAFVAGVVRKLGDVICAVERIAPESVELPQKQAYELILKGVLAEFQEDFWMKPYSKWLKRGGGLFHEDAYLNGGFPAMYSDLFDLALEEHKKDQEETNN